MYKITYSFRRKTFHRWKIRKILYPHCKFQQIRQKFMLKHDYITPFHLFLLTFVVYVLTSFSVPNWCRKEYLLLCVYLCYEKYYFPYYLCIMCTFCTITHLLGLRINSRENNKDQISVNNEWCESQKI